MTDIGINVPIGLTDRLTGGLKKLAKPIGSLEKRIQSTTSSLSKLGAQKKDIDHFRKLKSGVAATDKAMEAAKAQTQRLGRQLAATKNPSAQLSASFEKSRKRLGTLRDAQIAESRALDTARGKLKAAGISTTDLAAANKRLSDAIQKGNQKLSAQSNALKRVDEARDRMHRNQGRALKIGAAGAASTAAGYGGRAAISGLTNPVRGLERAKGELATLGIKDMEVIVAQARVMQGQLAGVTAESFISAAYDIRSGISGLTDAGVASMTASAVTVAKATKAMPEQMTSLFATSYGIFKKQFNEMGDADFGEMFGAVLAKSVQQFKTDGGKMQQAIESAGAFASNLGMGMQEQMAVLGMMQASMQAGESGTALRAFAEKAADAHEGFEGLSKKTNGNPIRVRVLDENGALRAMPDIMADLKERYGETLDAFESAEIKKVFGTTEALKMINTLWGQEEAMRANTAALNDAGDAGAEFTKQMAKAADNNFDSRMVVLGQQLDLLRQRFADQLVPVLDRVIPKIGAFVGHVGAWIDRNPALAQGLGVVLVGVTGLATTLGPLMIGVSGLVSSFGLFNLAAVKVATALPAIATAIGVVTKVLMANPIGIAVAAIAGAAYLIYNNWDWISGWFATLWDGVKSAVSFAWEGIKAIFFNYTPAGLVITHWQGIGSFFASLWEGIKAGVGIAWEGIKVVLLNYTPHALILNNWQGISTVFAGLGGDIMRGLSEGLSAGIQAVSDVVIGIGDTVMGTFKSLLGIASPSTVFSAFGGWIMDGLRDGLLSKIQQLRDAVSGIGSSVTGWFKKQLGIKSPSRVFMGLGGHISDGLAIGIGKGENGVFARMDRIRARIAAPLSFPEGGPSGAAGRAPLTPLAAAAFAGAASLSAAPASASSSDAGSVAYQPTYNVTVNMEGGGVDGGDIGRKIQEALAEHSARAEADMRRMLHD